MERIEASPTNFSNRLPKLSSGVCQLVIRDFKEAGEDYIATVRNMVRRQNPALFQAVFFDSRPDEKSIDMYVDNWMLCYYDLYARSASKQGRPMIVITEEVMSDYFATRKPAKPGEPDSEEVSLETQLVLKERSQSYESKQFWNAFSDFGKQLFKKRISPKYLVEANQPVYDLVALFHRQDESTAFDEESVWSRLLRGEVEEEE